MPHECTNCGRTFPDGSKEMLSGCPDCGGNKFQFTPSHSSQSDASDGSTADPGSADDAQTTPNEDTGWDSESGFTRATETVRNWVTSSDDTASSSDPTPPTDSTASATDPAASADSTASPADSTASPADTTPSSSGDEVAESDPSTAGSWPSSEESTGDSSTHETSEFEEWPETARRPEDRSSAANAGSSKSGDDRQSTPAETSKPPDTSPLPESTARDTEPPESPVRDTADRPDDSASTDGSSTDDSRAHSRTPIAESENSAQADARSGVVSNDDIPPGTVDGTAGDADRDGAGDLEATGADAASEDEQAPEHGRVVSEPTGEQPSMEELRAELNEQFESIKIVSPGQYELNLMELYNREEYIISLQEDGRYVIDVPDSWREADDE